MRNFLAPITLLGVAKGVEILQGGGPTLHFFNVRKAQDCAWLEENFPDKFPEPIEFHQEACACRWSNQPEGLTCPDGESWNFYNIAQQDGFDCLADVFFTNMLDHFFGDNCDLAVNDLIFTTEPTIAVAKS